MTSNNGLKNNYKQWLKLTLVHICNCLKRLQDQLKVLISYKIIRLILQPATFRYITARLYVLIPCLYISVYIYMLYICMLHIYIHIYYVVHFTQHLSINIAQHKQYIRKLPSALPSPNSKKNKRSTQTRLICLFESQKVQQKVLVASFYLRIKN